MMNSTVDMAQDERDVARAQDVGATASPAARHAPALIIIIRLSPGGGAISGGRC